MEPLSIKKTNLSFAHSAKGSKWEKHKYIKKLDGKYYYSDSYEGGRHLDYSTDTIKSSNAGMKKTERKKTTGSAKTEMSAQIYSAYGKNVFRNAKKTKPGIKKNTQDTKKVEEVTKEYSKEKQKASVGKSGGASKKANKKEASKEKQSKTSGKKTKEAVEKVKDVSLKEASKSSSYKTGKSSTQKAISALKNSKTLGPNTLEYLYARESKKFMLNRHTFYSEKGNKK